MEPADIIPAADAVVQTTQGGSIRAGVWTGVVVAALGVITVIVKQWGPWLTITGNQRRADIEGMGRRIAELEARLDRQTTEHAAKLDQERAQHAAEIQHMRHRMNNLDTSLTLLLALIEQDPTKASEAAARVRQKRERQEANEIAEKSVLTAARLVPTAILEE